MQKAMVVDDSRATRCVLRRTLMELGYEVYEAGNGQEAMELLDRESDGISLMLVDWNMPVMNGLELVRRIRAQLRFRSLTLMMVTTEGELYQVRRALEAGADEYLMKPFSREALEDKLRILGKAE